MYIVQEQIVLERSATSNLEPQPRRGIRRRRRKRRRRGKRRKFLQTDRRVHQRFYKRSSHQHQIYIYVESEQPFTDLSGFTRKNIRYTAKNKIQGDHWPVFLWSQWRNTQVPNLRIRDTLFYTQRTISPREHNTQKNTRSKIRNTSTRIHNTQ